MSIDIVKPDWPCVVGCGAEFCFAAFGFATAGAAAGDPGGDVPARPYVASHWSLLSIHTGRRLKNLTQARVGI